jgi:hypothetical protein
MKIKNSNTEGSQTNCNYATNLINLIRKSEPQHWSLAIALIKILICNAQIDAKNQASLDGTKANHWMLIKNQK